MTDSSSPLRIEWHFDASPERVYGAWVTPEVFRRWAWGTLGVETQAAIEPRVGGGFTVTTACPDGGTFAFKGRYTAVEVCTRLAFDITWEAPMGYDVPHERATVEFAGDGAGTTMTFVHDGVPDGIATATHEAGWRDTFALLERVLAE